MSLAASALPLAVVAPIVGGVAAPLCARVHRRLPLVVGLLSLLASIAVLLAFAGRVYGSSGQAMTTFLSAERPAHGHALGIALVAEPFGLTFALLATAVGTVLLLSMLSELGELGPREVGGLTCLTLLLLAALVGAALAGDAVNLFVWFEVAAIASYGLTGFFLERPIALEAAFKNLVLTSTAGFVLFAGVAMLYTTSGALNLGELHRALPVEPGRTQLVALALVVAAFSTKAGLVPFHTWLPDAHTPVPGAVSALFSALMVDLGVVGLARFGLLVVPGLHRLAVLLTVIGLTSAVLGAALALGQDDLKRLLAWDTVSQLGIIVAGLVSRTASGTTGAIYHMVSHALFKALLFLCAGAVVHATGLTQLSELGGLLRRRPLLAGAFVLGCLSIAGVPPFTGYGSLALLHDGLKDEPVAHAVALVAQTLTVTALARCCWLAFLRPRPEPYEHLEPIRAGMRVALGTLGAGCVVFGVAAGPVVRDVAAPAASALLHPTWWAALALGRSGSVPALPVPVDLLRPETIITAATEVVVGLALLGILPRLQHGIEPVRRLHTGSANDYAAFSLLGLIVCASVLLG